MNSEWQSFLKQHGAQITDEGATNFGDEVAELRAAREGTVICDLSHEGLIRVEGEDAQDFLQGQLTNDVRAANEYTHQFSGYCSPKGRLLALFRLFMRDGSYHLQLSRPLLDNILKRLRMFVLRSKVTLEDISDELVRFAVAGADAEQQLGTLLSNLPSAEHEANTTDGITVLRLMGPTPRFLLCGPLGKMQQLWQALKQSGTTPAGIAAWHWLQIQAGEPTVVSETVEAFVPQMLNLQLINGVSFKKGCYTGQEVVARMQYLGKLKRRMYLAHSDAEIGPRPGDELFSPESGSGQGAGKVVSVAPTLDGGYAMLAVIEISSIEGSGFYLDEAQQIPLKIEPPPYPFEQA